MYYCSGKGLESDIKMKYVLVSEDGVCLSASVWIPHTTFGSKISDSRIATVSGYHIFVLGILKKLFTPYYCSVLSTENCTLEMHSLAGMLLICGRRSQSRWFYAEPTPRPRMSLSLSLSLDVEVPSVCRYP